MSNLDSYREDLDSLGKLGIKMYFGLIAETRKTNLSKEQEENYGKYRGMFSAEYQNWYSEALVLIKQLLPDRLEEFIYLYKGDGKRKKIDITTYTIQDWLNGLRSGSNSFSKEKIFDDDAVVTTRFDSQLMILKSVVKRFESRLFEIRQLVQADLLDSELEAGRQLLKNGYLRAAGVVAGVVIEAHLQQVKINHNLPLRKKNPGISDYNELLKSNEVIDVPTWRLIQRLGDIRNICGHKKDREPEKSEVEELLNGAEKITKTIY